MLIASGGLCQGCFDARTIVVPLTVPVSSALAMQVHAVAAYEGVVARLVQAKELRDQKSAQQLGHIMVQYAGNALAPYDVIMPVPLHWSRFMYRGYNQATVMAQQLVRAGYGVYHQPFMRRRATPQQRFLEAESRHRNVHNAFCVKPYWSVQLLARVIAGKRVLLIDDVYTTGSTLTEFARLVARSSPTQLDALVACRV